MSMSLDGFLAGRGTFEPAGGWGGDHHDGVPIFILSRHQPSAEVAQWPLVTYVSDVETAIGPGEGAAGEKDVLVTALAPRGWPSPPAFSTSCGST
jgi:dihydrofolate reductase